MEPAFYAPQVRLVDLATGKIIGTNVTTTGEGAEKTVNTLLSPDLVSARVTLPATGIAQLSVTLNNQRFDHGKPKWPPWKYNDFSRKKAGDQQDSAGTYSLTFGQKVRLDIRYSTMTGWAKLIVARITDLQFSFPATGGAQLTVVGEDLLSVLKIKPKEDVKHDDGDEEAIARKTLKLGGLEKVPLRMDGIPARTKPLRAARQQASQTYYQYLADMADRMDCEFYVDFQNHRGVGDNEAQVGGGAVSIEKELRVVIEPARSAIKPTTKVDYWKRTALTPGEYVELRWGKSLIELKPKLKVWEMPTSASGSGSHPDRRGKAKVTVTETEIKAALQKELEKSPSYAVDMVDAITARTDFYDDVGDPPENNESSHGSGLDEPRLKMKALAGVMKKLREFMTAEGATIGVPMLRPGVYVHIIGLRPPFDGFYYVTQAVHSFDGTGYRTSFSLRRPGMLSPSGYESAASDEPKPAGAGS